LFAISQGGTGGVEGILRCHQIRCTSNKTPPLPPKKEKKEGKNGGLSDQVDVFPPICMNLGNRSKKSRVCY